MKKKYKPVPVFRNHSTLDFAVQDTDADVYTLRCTNKSTAPWVFYVYQKMPSQPSEIFSLAWFASPYRIGPNDQITFSWSIDYSFVWGNSGILQPGVNYDASGSQPASIQGTNQTTFSTDDGFPHLSTPTTGGQAGSLTVNQAGNVPNNVFATGIGMSGQGTFVQQALANTQQVYTPTPEYWIAAATQMQIGVVLAQTVSQTAKVTFPPSVFTMYATLDQNNTWSISQTPT
ncbi:MAG: protein RhiA [Bacteroidota bacterium]